MEYKHEFHEEFKTIFDLDKDRLILQVIRTIGLPLRLCQLLFPLVLGKINYNDS